MKDNLRKASFIHSHSLHDTSPRNCGQEKSFHVELEFLASVGNTFALINFQEPMSSQLGRRQAKLKLRDIAEKYRHIELQI